MNAISIIMPCYNRADDLLRVLQSYDRQETREAFELIAIDDSSSDDTYAVLSSYQSTRFTLTVIRQDENQGPAAARNLGISLATAPIVLFVGDDILPAKGFVGAHLAAHRKYPAREIAILGYTAWPSDISLNSLMVHIDGEGAEQFSYYYFKDGQEYDFRHFYTSNVSIKTNFLKSLDKWFDTDFFYAAFEDVELAYRLSQIGLKIIYSAAPVGYHYHYHTIWTFSTRQYRTGLMACILTQKHPELTRLIKGKNWALTALRLRFQSLLRPYPLEKAEQLERQLLYLASASESTENPLLNQFYLRLLRYFFYKGVIEGSFGNAGVGLRACSFNTRSVLEPLRSWFIQESFRLHTVLPQGNDFGESV